MKSIRAQLLGWLLPGFAVVCASASLGVYYWGKQAIEADLDARLGRLSGSARLALRNQMTAGGGGTRTPGLRAFLAKEEFQSSGQYFELWTVAGSTERRSPNLGDADLPRPTVLARDAVRYDGTLNSGDRVRISAMQFPQGGGMPPLEFAVAISRSEGEARLSRLLRDLAIGAVGCCAVLCLLQVLALRHAMRPLGQVGEQAAAMEAGSLHERFALEDMPLEVVPIVERLNDLMARREEGFERERQFSSYLAHELRTPLAGIRSTSEVAAKWPDQSSPDDFRLIAQAAARLQQTVESLLILSRLETSSADITIEVVALRPIIEECLALHSGRAEQRDLKFATQLERSPTLETDPRLLRIVVTNLIANATEYAPLGSEIVIAATDTDPFLRVGNLAPDLTPDDILRLFDRLWRKDATRSDAAHTGLGLSIARSCALALGFTLTAELDGGGVIEMSLCREK
ncbi:sensor histidine kinase [Brevifollis gellanilyticus]|uniref:histidine kinase n=1 Tax=Brevifollis gellanilyticus TaxID=748831 RepID=A0A512MBJ0_9BACT|nr:HAMP domain-containing sensor histidine kinase [Brevifollis gellanilyticus]GEP44094.1 two-component sensor histidine kinase [Brevifollis gellanilyticus]